jgi:hypothetical protein
MKAHVGIEAFLYAFLVFSKDECEQSGLQPYSFTLGELHANTNCVPQSISKSQSFNNMFKRFHHVSVSQAR